MSAVSINNIVVTTNAGSGTNSVTPPTLANGLLLLFLMSRDTSASVELTFSNVKVGTADCEFVHKPGYLAGVNSQCSVWMIRGANIPTGVSSSITWTVATGVESQNRPVVMYLEHVDQTNPIADLNSVEVNSAQPTSLGLEIPAGGLGIGLLESEGNHVITVNGSWDKTAGHGWDRNTSTSARQTGATLTTAGVTTWAPTIDVAVDNASVALSINSEDAAVPAVTSWNESKDGSVCTITGTGFSATGMVVDLNGRLQVTTSISTTQCSFVIDKQDLKFGVVNLGVLNGFGYRSVTGGFALNPKAGWAYVDVDTPGTDPLDYITTTPPAVNGDQLAWGDVVGANTPTPGVGTNGVSVFSDLSYGRDPGVTQMGAVVNDGTAWSAQQTLFFSTPSPGGTYHRRFNLGLSLRPTLGFGPDLRR